MNGRCYVALLFLLVLGSCDPKHGAHPSSLTEAAAHMHYYGLVYGRVWLGEVDEQYFYVALAPDQEYWGREGWCPVLLRGLEVSLQGIPMVREDAPEAARDDACSSAVFRLDLQDVRAELAMPDQLTVTVTDDSATLYVLSENMIRPPSVRIVQPLDGLLQRGGWLDVAVEPSVQALPETLVVGQGQYDPQSGQLLAGVGWGPLNRDDVTLDSHTLRIQVPADALLGESVLRFNTSNVPQIEASWRAGVLDCGGFEDCFVARVECQGGSPCGPEYMTGGTLDSPQVWITVAE